LQPHRAETLKLSRTPCSSTADESPAQDTGSPSGDRGRRRCYTGPGLGCAGTGRSVGSDRTAREPRGGNRRLLERRRRTVACAPTDEGEHGCALAELE
jgi:hypothetical protein